MAGADSFDEGKEFISGQHDIFLKEHAVFQSYKNRVKALPPYEMALCYAGEAYSVSSLFSNKKKGFD